MNDNLLTRAAALWQFYKDIDKVALQLCKEGYINHPSEFSELTLEETAKVLGASKQRVQQIEERAMKKLQYMLQFL